MKPTIQIDNNLSLIKDSSDYTCSIIVGRNYLTYALCDKACKVIYLLKHYYFEDKVIGKNDFNQILRDPVFKNVANVKIAIDSLKSTLVPIELFESEKASTYLELVHDVSTEEEIHTQEILKKIVSIFSLKKSTVTFLSSIYKNVKFYDASSCLLNTYPNLLLNDDYYTFYIGVKDDSATLSIYHKKSLQLHQVYADCSVTDINYYIANYIHIHKLDKTKTHISIHGESSRLSTVYNELIQFYPDVKYCSRMQNLQFPEGVFSQPSHYFFTLFSLVTCA